MQVFRLTKNLFTMTNKEIADIFSRIADILEIKGEIIFKVRAYRTAASNIQGLSRELSDIYDEDPGALGQIPGIGKDLKEKIIEMVTTGKLRAYNELLDEFSPGFIDMLNISGLGPKKLKKLRDELGIEDLDGLEKACRAGSIEKIEGMGARTQKKFIEAIEYYRKAEGRLLIPEASAYADKIITYLKKSRDFKKIEPAGSLRRGKETIGDLDILATAKDAEKAMDHFIKYPDIRDIIGKGHTKTSVILKSGVQVDLRIVDDPCFGAALVYFTGSQAHNIKLRTIAKKYGFKVNEYGVSRPGRAPGKEKVIASQTEKEVYKSLKMDWIPPEIREDQGEIEAAMAGKLPSLITINHIRGDLHIHSSATDGRNTIEEMAEKAVLKGYEYIAITDHSKLIRIANGMDERKLLKHLENIRRIGKRFKGVKILAGVEVDILKDGKLDLEDHALKELDIVVAAIHSNFSLDRKTQTERVLRGMDNKYVNILAHPSGRLITKRSPMELDFDKVFTGARERNVYMEINTHGKRIDLNDINCRRASQLGAKFVINTDSHDTSQLDEIVYGVLAARRGWVSGDEVLNTLPYERLIKALKR